MLLNINPNDGNKRGRRNKHKKITEDAKVAKLMSNIVKFKLNNV